ncbi:PAS domain S-box protein [Gracilimonas sp.]|uniref:PAS domain S-box protein n=1 Tax=Gracilimonas sp. TaxID=1974203 RepID=UPI0032EF5D72
MKEGTYENQKLIDTLEQCISQSNLGVVILDKNFKVISTTDKITEWFGYQLEELQNNAATELAFNTVDEEDLQLALKSIDSLLEGKMKSTCYHFRIIAKDGSVKHTRWYTTLIDDQQGNPLYFISIVENFTGLKELEDSQQRFAEILESTPDFIGLAKADGNVMFVNGVGQSMLGFEQLDVTETRVSCYVPDDTYRHLQDEIFPFASRFGSWTGEFNLQRSDGTPIPVAAVINAHKNSDNETEYYSAVCHNITNYQSIQDSLRVREERLQLAMEGGNIGFWDYYPQDNRVDFDKELMSDALGYLPAELSQNTEKWNKLIHPEDLKPVKDRLKNHIIGNLSHFEAEFRLKRKDGSWCWIQCRAKVVEIDDNESPLRITGIYQDINDRKAYEQQLEQSVMEKQVLLQEVHHRVKNNLAIISGLMQLQDFTKQNEAFSDLLLTCQMRIKTIAMIHEILYQSESLSKIDFNLYVHNLNELIRNTLNPKKGIRLSISCEPFLINVNQAIPCALILNELITNSVKHAFPTDTKGTITINVTMADNIISLEVKDDGIGLPEDFEQIKDHSLGFTIIDVLVKQLKAEYEITSKEGTVTRLSFKREDLSGSASSMMD